MLPERGRRVVGAWVARSVLSLRSGQFGFQLRMELEGRTVRLLSHLPHPLLPQEVVTGADTRARQVQGQFPWPRIGCVTLGK